METYSPDEFDRGWRELQAEFDKHDLTEKIKNILAVNPELARCKYGDGRGVEKDGCCTIHNK